MNDANIIYGAIMTCLIFMNVNVEYKSKNRKQLSNKSATVPENVSCTRFN